MKRFIFLLAFLCLRLASIGQSGYINRSSYELQTQGTNGTAIVISTFQIGGSSCPRVDSWMTHSSGDTFFVQAIYAIYGVFQNLGCGSSDTLQFTFSSGAIKYVNISTTELFWNHTTSQPDTAWNLWDSTFALNPTRVYTSKGQQLFHLWPNPCTNTLHLDWQTQEPMTLTIYNVMGQLVFTEQKHFLNTPLDVSKLPGGVYYVRGTAGAQAFQATFVKQ